MRITLESDYALRICSLLAKNDGITDNPTIAKTVHISESFSLKILRKLSYEGIVRAQRGHTGGYALAKPPFEISIKNIIEAIDGSIEITHCISDEYLCSLNGENKDCCAFHRIFVELNRKIAAELDKITLDCISDNRKIDEILSEI